MGRVYNTRDDIHWYDTTAEIISSEAVILGKTAKAAALDAPSVIYISNGTSWVSITG